MPIGSPAYSPAPKSGCTGSPRPIDAISRAEFFATDSRSTRWFHGLFGGNTGQRGAPGRGCALASAASSAAKPTANRAPTRRTAAIIGGLATHGVVQNGSGLAKTPTGDGDRRLTPRP